MKVISFKKIVPVTLLFAGAMFFNTTSVDAEELTTIGGENDKVLCNCNFWGNCKASGSRALCAQSEAGGNVNCRTYNSNC